MKDFMIYVCIAIVGFVLIWVSWQITINTIPPIKVLIVGGCK